MIYYIILFLIIFLNFIIEDKKKYCYIIGTILILFAGLRANIIGPDTPQYEYLFNQIKKYSFKASFKQQLMSDYKVEWGYFMLQSLFTKLGDYNLFKFFCSFVSLAPAIYIIYKYSVNKCVSFLVFFTLPVYTMVGMSMMRQGIAFGFFLYAFDCILEKKQIKYILTILFASLFHMSAIILLPIYYIYSLPYKRKFNWYIIGVLALFFIFNSLIFIILTKYSRIKYETGEAGGIKMLIFLLILLASTWLIKERKLRHPFIKFQLYLLVWTILCWSIGMNLAAVFRLAAYTEFYLCLFIPNLYKLLPKQNQRKGMIAISCFVCILIMATIVMRERDFFSYYPFYFLWEK